MAYNEIINNAKQLMNQGDYESLSDAIDILETLLTWKLSPEQLTKAHSLLKQARRKLDQISSLAQCDDARQI